MPIVQQAGQAAELIRLSLSMCLCSGSSTVKIGEPYSAYCTVYCCMCKFECTVLAYCFCTLSTFVYLGILRGPAAAPLPIIWRKDAKYGNGLIFYRITSISEENTNSLPPPPAPQPRPACTVTCKNLKVPKLENFSIAFFAQSEPIWICDIGTSKKIELFSRLTPDFDGFWFFAAY